MSVYTPVSSEDLDAWLARYAVGALADVAPIAAGIENTNYFVTTAKGRYVLTLYERLPAEDLPFFLNLMAHLARAGVPVPAPEPDRTGAFFSILNGKPASLIARVEGAGVKEPTLAHCHAVGIALAQLHVASRGYRSRLANRRGPRWWRQAARAVRPFLSPEQDEFMRFELDALAGYGDLKLEKGAIHADLFCDNVLFSGQRVAGIIDFGFAATDFFAYDLAIAVNDWGDVGEASMRDAREQALVDGYQSLRPLGSEEQARWHLLLRAAALRFWLSRLYDLHLPRPGELVHAHDPSRFERILRERSAGDAPTRAQA